LIDSEVLLKKLHKRPEKLSNIGAMKFESMMKKIKEMTKKNINEVARLYSG